MIEPVLLGGGGKRVLPDEACPGTDQVRHDRHGRAGATPAPRRRSGRGRQQQQGARKKARTCTMSGVPASRLPTRCRIRVAVASRCRAVLALIIVTVGIGHERDRSDRSDRGDPLPDRREDGPGAGDGHVQCEQHRVVDATGASRTRRAHGTPTMTTSSAPAPRVEHLREERRTATTSKSRSTDTWSPSATVTLRLAGTTKRKRAPDTTSPPNTTVAGQFPNCCPQVD